MSATPPVTLNAKIVAQLRRFVPWTFPLKLALGTVLGALGGAGFLGYMSEYATYSYAIYYGLRPPLEGIPYLKAAVALGSLLLLLTGAAVFLLSIVLVRLLVWFTEWVFRIALLTLRRLPRSSYRRLDFAHVASRLAARPAWQLLLVAIAVGSLAAAVAYGEMTLLSSISLPQHSKLFPVMSFSVAVGLFAFLVTLAMAKRTAIWWLAIAATALYFCSWIGLLFSPGQYSGFLRLVGYGGGLQVSVEMRDTDHPSAVQPTEYFLLLRTTEALIVLDASRDKIIELPRDQVRMISHAVGGLRRLPHRLPSD